MSAVTHHKARVGALSRSRAHSDAELIEARQSLKEAKLAAYVSRVVAEAPSLTPEQLDRVAVLLRPGGVA